MGRGEYDQVLDQSMTRQWEFGLLFCTMETRGFGIRYPQRQHKLYGAVCNIGWWGRKSAGSQKGLPVPAVMIPNRKTSCPCVPANSGEFLILSDWTLTFIQVKRQAFVSTVALSLYL